MEAFQTTKTINEDASFLSIIRQQEQVGCVTKAEGILQRADSDFLRRMDVLELIKQADTYELVRDNLFFVVKDAKSLGKHVASWGADTIGDRLFGEIFDAHKYPYDTLLGTNIVYSDGLLAGEMYLMYGTPGGDRQAIGRVRTRLS